MVPVCKPPLLTPNNIEEIFIYIIVVLFFMVCVFLSWHIIKVILETYRKLIPRISIIIAFTIAMILAFILVSFLIIGIIGIGIPTNGIASGSYPDLNAAIKNTCFLDPQKNHCPKTVQDIINIKPQSFVKLTENAVLTYEYYPDTNQYTLIVREKSMWMNNNQVAVFDPRLTIVKNYGMGFDFVDTEAYECNGKFVLKNPPPFPGPWKDIN